MNSFALENKEGHVYNVTIDDFNLLKKDATFVNASEGMKTLLNITYANSSIVRMLLDYEIIQFDRLNEYTHPYLIQWLYRDWETNWRTRSILSSLDWRNAVFIFKNIMSRQTEITQYINETTTTICIPYDHELTTPEEAIALFHKSDTDETTCPNGCCIMKTTDFKNKEDDHINDTKRMKKTGILLYDPKTSSVLLIQSRGNLWGIPKGTLNEGETTKEGAIREVEEETGIRIDINTLDNYTCVGSDRLYYYLEYPKNDVEVQTHIVNNDANSIGWIKKSCLHDMIKDKTIRITYDTSILIEHFL
jgi:hypothetical protein|uniref:Nudix hydrolase domain-containing protein n=1 Tax=viral metagenome TaxID=1070528 RepID=A0A6C0LSR8_9ZZZZ